MSLKNKIKTEKVKKGKYLITRLDDGEVYDVLWCRLSREWVIGRRSDGKVDGHPTLGGAKLMIGEWRYI